jgi:hypothetical protein
LLQLIHPGADPRSEVGVAIATITGSELQIEAVWRLRL